MKTKRLLVGIALIALLVGLTYYQRERSKNELGLKLLKTVPEIDSAALKDIMDVQEAVIGPERVYVNVTGLAKADLGEHVLLAVDRYHKDKRVDTVAAYIASDRPPRLPEGYVMPKVLTSAPPYDFDIYAGDPVRISVDATAPDRRFTRLALRPDTESPASDSSPVSAPDSQPAIERRPTQP